MIDLDFDMELTGFSNLEIDGVLDFAREASVELADAPEDEVPAVLADPVSRLGDPWILGNHKLLCGDARNPSTYDQLLDGMPVDIVFTDPPYNVPIDGNVTGLGKQKYREFAMASGELSREKFVGFLRKTLGHMARLCREGAIAFACMDWRQIGELLKADTFAASVTNIAQNCRVAVDYEEHAGQKSYGL